MNDHLSTSQLRGLAVGHLAPGEYEYPAQHIASCEQCHLRFMTQLQDEPTVSSFSLNSEFWFQHDHLTFAQLTSMADDTVDHESLGIIDAHLNSCALCRDSLDSLLTLRDEVQEFKVSRTSANAFPQIKTSVLSNKGIAWHPDFLVAGAILITLATLAGLIVLSKRSKSSVSETAIAVTSPPGNPTSASPGATEGSSGSAVKENELVALLNDGPQAVAIYADGRIEGLRGISLTTSQEVSRAILNGRVKTPNVLMALSAGKGSLRGGNDRTDNFKLIYPSRQVIVETRPRFRWKSLPGVSSYQVYVVNSVGRPVAISEVLPPGQLEWTPQKSLRRGEVFNWTVVAVIDQKEVISPSPSEP
ncbi:MAG TPA: hypothetical protein VFH91_09145, partial [Pyrinomonadaceae bacterium]|nr:hypothetical protein [Pyrinomonadaceae bacterium]